MTEEDKPRGNNLVGPIMRQGALAKAVMEAAEIDNPGKDILVEDQVAYVRIQAEGEMTLQRETVEEMLGKPFKISELEVEMASFTGRISTEANSVRFYFINRV